VTYGYDPNGSETSVTRTGAGAESDIYTFDLQHRLATANTSRTENGTAVTISASYAYNTDGIRVQSVTTTTIGAGSPSTTTTQFLIDSLNPTGYAQVLEEHTNGSATASESYILGLSVLAQAASAVLQYLLPDAQGSTRQLVDALGNILARYAYDAYGNPLGGQVGVTNPPLTRYLYTAQQFDSVLLQYYLRARYYAPPIGRFTASDPFSGDPGLPESLQKYFYAKQNPINYSDPSGQLLEGAIGFVGDLLSSVSRIVNYIPLLLWVHTQAFLWTHPLVTLAGQLILTGSLLYALLFHPEARADFLAMYFAQPFEVLEPLASDFVGLYQGAKALFGARFSLANLASEANDVLSAVGSNVHPHVPPYSGGKTRGVFSAAGTNTEVPLISADGNPGLWLKENLAGGPGSGLNATVPTHVEGHAAAIMNKYDIMNAELFINQPPCRKSGMCRYTLSKLLPPGSELKVHFLDEDNVTVHTWLFQAGVPLWKVLE
jgi:RHS repeat-associated protein